MSAALRQQTCAACGRPFAPTDAPDLEVMVDVAVRYVAVHQGTCTTYASSRPDVATLIELRLRVTLTPWQRELLANVERSRG